MPGPDGENAGKVARPYFENAGNLPGPMGKMPGNFSDSDLLRIDIGVFDISGSTSSSAKLTESGLLSLVSDGGEPGAEEDVL